MFRLPPPGNFAEGQRQLYGILAALAGIFCGAASIAMIALLMWGRWSTKEEHSIVVIFGWSLGGYVTIMAAVIVGLLAGGPVGRFEADVSAKGVSLKAGQAADQVADAAVKEASTINEGGEDGEGLA